MDKEYGQRFAVKFECNWTCTDGLSPDVMFNHIEERVHNEFERAVVTSVIEVEEVDYETQKKVGMEMVVYGGTFAYYLGKALIAADCNNGRKIREAFPEMWTKYLAIANKAEVI